MEFIDIVLDATKIIPNQAADKFDETADKVLKMAFLSFLVDIYSY
ncbi:MAG: hypothetical protein Q7R95_09660 [bacterium]|nr:hypothetical protein [bacterium]